MTEVLVIYNAHLVDCNIDSLGAVVVVGGKIRTVFLGNCPDQQSAAKLVGALVSDLGSNLLPSYFDARKRTLLPAFIDMHVHFRYPGQTQKEDLDSGLHAAIAGGFGTLVLMPNTAPVISTRKQALAVEQEAAKRKLCRIFQTQSITKAFDGEDISELDSLSATETPVITEDGHDVNSAAVMFEAMRKAGKHGVMVSCHCEDVQLAQAAKPYRERALGFMKKCGYLPYYLYRQGYMAGDLENIGCARPGAEGMYNIQIMEEHQTIIGIGGAATTKVVDRRAARLKSSFNAKDLATYLRDIDVYIEKRKQLLAAAYE